jgi:preprotein translocase subunit SecE
VARNRKRAKERRARRPEAAQVAAARREENEAPRSIEHATPDTELAEAQLAVGRPDPPDPVAEVELEEELELEAAADAPPAATPDRVRERREPTGRRLVHFIQGSWHELQRVQWPDRRQVMQATGVVIGFVIVAGVFLGVADFLAGKIMNYVLTGHFK